MKIDAQVVNSLCTDDIKFVYAVVLLILLSRSIGAYITLEAAA